MNNFDFSNVKDQKAAAMRTYNRQKKLKSFLFLVEVLFAALALLLWYSTYYVPFAAVAANGFLRRSVVFFARSLYVFVIINVLVVVIFVLSCQKPTEPDFYDEYVSITTANVSGRTVSYSAAADRAPDEYVTTVSDRQIVCVDNAVHNPPAEKTALLAATVKAAAAAASAHEPIPAVSPVRKSRFEAAIETKKYRRTRSERFGKETRPELRRSETVGREPARKSASAMDDLSSEEFQLTIDTYIAAKKKCLIRENTLDLKLERKECVSITLSRFN